MANNHMPFRRDIEGLRALAVLAVLAFHHQWGPFTGGFVGVDVFFVISGYLITRNILLEIQARVFSYKEFYIRRVRRLFPALFFTVAITLLFGIFIASPSDLQHIAASSMATIFSVANIYFWNQAGYFDAAAIQKPLLHTWSLAVEEQFYFVWPLLVALLIRYSKSQRVAIALLAILGIFSVWQAERWMAIDPAGVFYLTHFRISEFVFGALCAWIPARSHRGQLEGEVFSLVALGMIVYPIFSYSDATPFPGLAALLPCIGATLLILFNGGGVSRWILTNPVSTGIGKISYSLYLVHWPIYVFYRQWKGAALNYAEIAAACLLTITLAVFMYKFIEQPFRARGASHAVKIPTGKFVKLFAGLTVILITLLTSITLGKGWAWRYPINLNQIALETESQRQERFKPFAEHCRSKAVQSCDMATEGINIFIVGDSHAPDIYNALVDQYPALHYVYYGLGGCPPLAREDYVLLKGKHPNRDACLARNERLLYGDTFAKANLVVINTVFDWYKPEHLTHAIVQIRKSTRAPIIVLGNYLIFDDDLPDLAIKHGSTQMDDYYTNRLSESTFAFENELAALSKALGFTYISKKKLFCGESSIMSCPIMIDGKLISYDRHHLSLAAAQHLGRKLKNHYNAAFTFENLQ